MFGWLKKRKSTPVEERSYAGVYAFWSGVLFLTTMWAVWNEVSTRRPWKEYQSQFYEMKVDLLGKRLAEARQGLDRDAIKALSKELSATKAKWEGPEIQKVISEEDRFKREVIDFTRERANAKSKVDATNYLYEHNTRLMDAAEAAASRKERTALEAVMNAFEAKIEDAERKIDSVDAILAPVSLHIKDVQAQIDSLSGPVPVLEGKIDIARTAPLEIKQVILEAFDRSNWGMTKSRIDRCQTCHMGWNDSLFLGVDFEEGIISKYSSAGAYVHKNYGAKAAAPVIGVLQQALFGKEGMALSDSEAKSALESALGKNKDDASTILKKFSGEKERLIGLKKVFGTHPQLDLIKKHNPEKFGCTSCHAGQGMALSDVEQAHGFEEHWDAPLLTSHYVEGSCVNCHAGRAEFAPYAQWISTGKKLFQDFGCYSCHDNVDVPDFRTMKQAASLRRVASKLTPSFMFSWIKNPSGMNPHTRMPNSMLSDDQADAVVTYLTQASDAEGYVPDANAPAGNAAKGKSVLEHVGCLGCHGTKDFPAAGRLKEGNSFGPHLSGLAGKITRPWLVDWLKNPKHYSPTTRMPSLRLTDAEVGDVAAYLLQDGDQPTLLPHEFTRLQDKAWADSGAKVITDYGCYGCHSIKGFEDRNKLSVSLAEFGKKLVQQLSWGTIPEDTLSKVREHFASVGLPLGKSINAHHDEDWYTWTILKLKNPRIFQTDQIVQRMSNFSMSDSEAYAISVYLRSLRKTYVAPQFLDQGTAVQTALDSGRNFVRWNNCVGCHKVEGAGGSVSERIKVIENVPDALAYSPPIITPEGAKVQEQWLTQFLRSPSPIRPWLQIRMPTFGFTDSMVTIAQKYFLAIQGQTWGEKSYDSFTPDPALAAGGQILFTKFQCIKCHQMGAVTDVTSLAPNLQLARSRLKPDWIPEWLRDPNAIQQGTRMPSFFPDGQSPAPDILGGDSQKQMKALRDVVMSLGKKKSV